MGFLFPCKLVDVMSSTHFQINYSTIRTIPINTRSFCMRSLHLIFTVKFSTLLILYDLCIIRPTVTLANVCQTSINW